MKAKALGAIYSRDAQALAVVFDQPLNSAGNIEGWKVRVDNRTRSVEGETAITDRVLTFSDMTDTGPEYGPDAVIFDHEKDGEIYSFEIVPVFI